MQPGIMPSKGRFVRFILSAAAPNAEDLSRYRWAVRVLVTDTFSGSPRREGQGDTQAEIESCSGVPGCRPYRLVL